MALARDPFWRDEHSRLIGTHPRFPDAAYEAGTTEDVMHALALILSRLPAQARLPFAESFYARYGRSRGREPRDAREQLTAAASICLLVADLAVDELRSDRIVDLLAGAAQGDDLTLTPAPAVVELEKSVARVRFDVTLEDPADPRAAASLAIAEVLIPSGDVVALKEVAARCAWAAVESWEPERVLDFLLACAAALEER